MNVMNELDEINHKKPFPFCLIRSILTKYVSLSLRLRGIEKKKDFSSQRKMRRRRESNSQPENAIIFPAPNVTAKPNVAVNFTDFNDE